jgi:hypothetical protein
MQHWDIKILKNTHILVHNQNFEKQKKWNSKIPEPHPLLLESMKYVKKSGHGEEWVNISYSYMQMICKTFSWVLTFFQTGLISQKQNTFYNFMLNQYFCVLNLWLFSSVAVSVVDP